MTTLACSQQIQNYRFERYLLDVTLATFEHGGTTSKLGVFPSVLPTDGWAFPKYPEKTHCIPINVDVLAHLRAYTQRHRSALQEPDSWLGTWIHPQTYEWHLDITLIVSPRQRAKEEIQRRFRQKEYHVQALFDIGTKQIIFLEGER